MPTFTTKAQLKNGLLEPRTLPPFGDPDEVVVTFVKYEQEDPDEVLFREIEPQYRRVRREVFKEKYPELYKKYYGLADPSDT